MAMFKAAIFDWAGTMVDFGSFAPMGVFVKVFAQFGITATIAQARAPMGSAKRDHIRAMLQDPDIKAQWQLRYGTPASEADVERLYEVFVPMNEQIAADYAQLIPGALESVAYLKARGIRVGSTTGYTRSIMERVLPVAAAQGYAPETVICSDDLPEGRPGPLGIYQCMVDLVSYPPSALLKVDDTAPGIAEGAAAGCVCVGVMLTGNAAGLSAQEVARLSEAEKEALRCAVAPQLRAAGADHLIDSVADLPALLDELDPIS